MKFPLTKRVPAEQPGEQEIPLVNNRDARLDPLPKPPTVPSSGQATYLQYLDNLNVSWMGNLRSLHMALRIGQEQNQIYPHFAHAMYGEVVAIAELLQNILGGPEQ